MTAKIVFIPGLACNADIWRDQLKVLEPLYDCEVIDRHLTGPNLETMAAAILANYSCPLIVVGHSMGGMIAQTMYRQKPTQISAMALIASSSRAEDSHSRELKLNALNNLTAKQLQQLLCQQAPFTLYRANQRPEIVKKYLAAITTLEPQLVLSQNIASLTRTEQTPYLRSINCPTLILCGKYDKLTPPADSVLLSQCIANNTFFLIDDCAHMPTIEQPEITTQLLSNWLLTLPAINKPTAI